MARFLHHESCPSCGSSDNVGRYDDGSAYCFGCGYVEPADGKQRRTIKGDRREEEDDSIPKLPEDAGTSYSGQAINWMAAYYVSVEQAISNGILWSNSRQQLIFKLEDGCWQARNFTAGKSKYFTAGNVNDSIKVYLPRQLELGVQEKEDLSKTLVVVEDCISAIRVSEASRFHAMPILGSVVATSKLNRLARLYGRLIVWNDSDKLTEARNLVRRAQMLGMDAKTVHTIHDPKVYTNDQIREFFL